MPSMKKLLSILKSKTICSRDYLEKQGIKLENDNPSFKLDISTYEIAPPSDIF